MHGPLVSEWSASFPCLWRCCFNLCAVTVTWSHDTHIAKEQHVFEHYSLRDSLHTWSLNQFFVRLWLKLWQPTYYSVCQVHNLVIFHSTRSLFFVMIWWHNKKALQTFFVIIRSQQLIIEVGLVCSNLLDPTLLSLLPLQALSFLLAWLLNPPNWFKYVIGWCGASFNARLCNL